MVELICLTEGCQFNRIITNLVEIVPHINGQHKLVEINDFEMQFRNIQSDVNNLQAIDNIFLHIIATLKKQLNKLITQFEDRLIIQTQNMRKCRMYQLKDLTVIESITKLAEFTRIKADKIIFENQLLEQAEEYFYELADQFSKMSDCLEEYDELVNSITKQQVITNIKSEATVIHLPQREQLTQNLNQSQEECQQSLIRNVQIEEQLKPLRGYKNIQSNEVINLSMPQNNLQQEQNLNDQSKAITEQKDKIGKNKRKRLERQQENIKKEEQELPSILQVKFNSLLSTKQFKITETVFSLSDCSKVRFMLFPKNPQTSVKIGIVCLNRWNKNQSIIDQQNSAILTETYIIDKEEFYTLKFTQGTLIYPRIKKQVQLIAYNYQADDTLSFYIEHTQAGIRLMNK